MRAPGRRRRRVLALAVAVLAVTAGCSSLAGVGGDRGTVTPAPVPSATETPVPLPPGVTWEGVESVEALAAAHSQAVRGRSYVWRERLVRTERAGPVEVTTRRVETLRVVDGTHYRHDFWRAQWLNDTFYAHRYNSSHYADGETLYRRYMGVDPPSYARDPLTSAADEFARSGATPLYQYLDVANATVAPVERDGRRYYRVESRTPTAAWLRAVENYSVVALVAPDGFVRELRVSYDVAGEERRERVTYRYAYERVGNVTLRPPAWLDEARANLSGPPDV